MDKTALQNILKTEKEADEIISVSIKKANKIAMKSTLELKKTSEEYEELLDIEVKKIIAGKIKEAENKVKGFETSFLAECNQIRKAASVNINKAVEYVIGKVGDDKWQ